MVGVSEVNRRKQADILDMLSNTVFAGDNSPEVRVDTILLEGLEIDVLTVLNSFRVPFYLKSKSKKYNTIKERYIYTRVGDKNTPISQNASIQHIEMLWKKRLGLTQPPLEQIVSRLENKCEWAINDETHYDYKLQKFFFDSDDMEEVYAKRRFDEVILYFDDNKERLSFEFYTENRQKLVEQYIEDADKTYFQIDVRDEHVKIIEKHRLSTGLALNRLLKEYREMLTKSALMI